MPIADVGFAYASGIYQLNSNEHICSKSYAIHNKIACKMTHPDDSESQNRDEISDLKSEEIRNSFVFQMSSVHRIILFQAKHVINTNEKMSLTFGPAPRQKKILFLVFVWLFVCGIFNTVNAYHCTSQSHVFFHWMWFLCVCWGETKNNSSICRICVNFFLAYNAKHLCGKQRG